MLTSNTKPTDTTMAWTGLHARLSWPQQELDTFIAESLAPLLHTYRTAGRVADWYFLRYWETGPHLRIRVLGADAATIEQLTGELRELVASKDVPLLELDPAAYYGLVGAPADTEWRPHGDVRQVHYEPETERYGGADALPVAEDLFCRSTEVAIAVLRAARSSSAKLSAAIELAMATAKGLDLDRPAAAAWLRTMGTSWRLSREPAPRPTTESHGMAAQLLASRGPQISRRWDQPPNGATRYWIEALRAARSALVEQPRDRWHGVWASQLHMLLNRLGIAPGEERMVCWLVASALLSPNGIGDFHDATADAADRRYLESSRFLPGFAEQLPRRHPPTAPVPPPAWQPVIALPAPAQPSTSLVSALRARRTSRGPELSGPLNATQLAGLLWTAHAPLAEAQARRPYPSAGASYCARLRLIARTVDGLAAGCYQVEPTTRTLRWIAPTPPLADLEATSMWFGSGAQDKVADGATDLAAVPALLGLYVRIGELRETYGARALRFAFAEAGHLAQNLGLVAAALPLRLGLIGGFYDDIAHDVLGLDGVDDVLAYLLPIG